MSNKDLENEVREYQKLFGDVKSEIAKVVVGQEALVHRLLIGLITGGHVLVEGVPGLAKTLLIRTLSECLNVTFSRIQFTPDMLPVDVMGTEIFNPKEATFSIKKGPVFGNLVLADEINRAPAKVQSALLEAMQEKQVTIGRETFRLEAPFLVMATQNPIEQEGTYPLPEAQLDRFFMRVNLGYPTPEEEADILERFTGGAHPMEELRPICSAQDVVDLQEQVSQVYSSKEVRAYISQIAQASRKNPSLQLGVSTRGAIFLLRGAQARALLQGRDFVAPEDVQKMVLPVLAHRVILSPEARMRGMTAERVLSGVIGSVQVPVRR